MNLSSDQKNHEDMKEIHVSIGGPGTRATSPLPLPGPIVFQFHAGFGEKIAKIIGWRTHWTHYLMGLGSAKTVIRKRKGL